MYYIGIDVGGQTIKAGVVSAEGQLVGNVCIIPTESERGNAHFLEQLCIAVRLAAQDALLELSDVVAIGVATPGLMDIPGGILTHPVNMPALQNVPVREHVRKTFNKPTAFQNDANAAAYGEFWAGAGKGTRSLVLFTLGTGIGCGIVWDSKIIEGEHSHGAEVGHIIIQAWGGRMCGCGHAGHLEAYASETALRKIMSETLDEPGISPSVLHQIVTSQGLTARSLFQAYQQGDRYAEQIVKEAAYALAVGATCMMHSIDPELVLFGGGMSVAAGPDFLELIQQGIQSMAFPIPAKETRIEYATLAEKAGLVGAAGWAKHMIESSTTTLKKT